MGDWLMMAADLTLLRSRLLVLADAATAQDAQDEAERLRQRLLGRWRSAALRTGWRAGTIWGATCSRACSRTGQGSCGLGGPGTSPLWLRACLTAIRLPAEAGARYRVPGPPFWSVADATERIRTMLKLIGEGGAALEMFLPEVPVDAPERELRYRVAGTFLAGLEPTRDGSIIIQQLAAWTPIELRPRQGSQ